jgi:hypothetical protein
MAILHVPFGKAGSFEGDGRQKFYENRVDRRTFEVMVKFSADCGSREPLLAGLFL